METVLFYLLSGVLVLFAALTVTARNPVRSAVFLVSALLAVAGLFFLLHAEFVGAVQIIVYVGGIMVLFLFVIMLVSVRRVTAEPRAGRQWRAGVAVGALVAGELLYFIIKGGGILASGGAASVPPDGHTQNVQSVGTLLYTNYLLPFEIASVLLLVAIIGAVVLSKKQI